MVNFKTRSHSVGNKVSKHRIQQLNDLLPSAKGYTLTVRFPEVLILHHWQFDTAKGLCVLYSPSRFSFLVEKTYSKPLFISNLKICFLLQKVAFFMCCLLMCYNRMIMLNQNSFIKYSYNISKLMDKIYFTDRKFS